MSLATTCRRIGCGAPAEVIPAIDLYADRRLYPTSPPATMLLGLPHCRAHAEMTTIDMLLDDGGWAQVEASFRAINRATPRREDAVLRWHHVDGEIVKAWQRSVELTKARAEREQRHRDN